MCLAAARVVAIQSGQTQALIARSAERNLWGIGSPSYQVPCTWQVPRWPSNAMSEVHLDLTVGNLPQLTKHTNLCFPSEHILSGRWPPSLIPC